MYTRQVPRSEPQPGLSGSLARSGGEETLTPRWTSLDVASVRETDSLGNWPLIWRRI